MKKVSFIIPCYNEEESLPILYQRLNNVANQLNNYKCEFIFINDGSKDKTEEIIENLNKNDNRVKLFSFSRNFGQYEAINCGIAHATGDLAITMDADLQDSPEIIIAMIQKYEETGVDIIYCSRISRKGESLLKKISSTVFYNLINMISNIKFETNNNSEFRLINRKVIDYYNNFTERPKYIRLILNFIGFKKYMIEYEQNERIAGKTKYSYKKLFKLALSIIFSYSRNLIKIFIYIGLFIIFLSILSIFILLYFHTKGHSIELSYYIMACIFIVLGFQFISLYILGEYILNIREEVKNRPRYIISKKIE